jgi:glycosyltransferase involved in cell wall biosynthesis
MHVLLIHQAFVSPNEAGGTRHYEFARYLVERGHRFTIVCSDVSYLTGKVTGRRGRGLWSVTTDAHGVEIRRVRAYSAHHKSFLHRSLAFATFSLNSLLAAVTDVKPDVVIGTSPPPLQPFSALLAARWHRVPFIFEIRDLFWEYAIQTGAVKANVMVNAARRFEDWLCRRADHLLVNSPGFIPHLVQHGNPGEKITLIPNAADIDLFHPGAAQRSVWMSYGCQDKFIVLYAGAHGMLNDLDTLLDAAVFLRDYPDIRVCLIGDGKEKPSLMQRAQRIEANNVIFIPPQPKSDMPAFVASADACVAILRDLPILRTVYPNKVFDYMAAGRPVILAIDGEIRQVIESADAGVCVPPGDSRSLAQAILDMYQHRTEAEARGANGRKYVVEHFNRLDQAIKLENLLRCICENRTHQSVGYA